jgi:hypothetical protein
MRTLSKPSTAKGTLEHDTAFLLAEAQSAGCVRLSEVSGGAFAHDAVNRFLNREAYGARDLFEAACPLIALEGGILSVDDTILSSVAKVFVQMRGSVQRRVCLLASTQAIDVGSGRRWFGRRVRGVSVACRPSSG